MKLLDTWVGGRGKASPSFGPTEEDALRTMASSGKESPVSIAALLNDDSGEPDELFLPPMYEAKPKAPSASFFTMPSVLKALDTCASPASFTTSILPGGPSLSDAVYASAELSPAPSLMSILSGSSPLALSPKSGCKRTLGDNGVDLDGEVASEDEDEEDDE